MQPLVTGAVNMTSESRMTGLLRNIRWGLRWGCYYGGFYGVLMLLVVVFSDQPLMRDTPWSNWAVLATYVLTCISIGAFVGILRPFTRTWLGTVVVGMIIGFSVGAGAGLFLMGPNFRNPGYLFVVPLLTCAGGAGAWIIRTSLR